MMAYASVSGGVMFVPEHIEKVEHQTPYHLIVQEKKEALSGGILFVRREEKIRQAA